MPSPWPNFTTVAQPQNKALPTSEPQFPTSEMKVTTNASPLPSLPGLSGRRTRVGFTVPEWAHLPLLDPGSRWASYGLQSPLSPAGRPLCPHEAPLLPRLAGAPHVPPYSHPAWNPSVGQEGQESPGVWVQLVGYQMANYQVVGPLVVGCQVTGHQVASCGGWGTGLGSGADTRSRCHTRDCQRPETFNPEAVPHSPTALPISATPTH